MPRTQMRIETITAEMVQRIGVNRIVGVAWYEVKLQLRSMGLWACALLVSVYTVSLVLIGSGEVLPSTRAMLNSVYPQSLAALNLFCLFICASAVARARGERVDEYADASSYRGYQMVIGQFLGLSFLMTGLNAAILVLLGVLQSVYGSGPVDWGAVVRTCLGVSLPSITLSATLGMVAGEVLGTPLVTYPLLAGYWLGVMVLLHVSPYFGFLDPTGRAWVTTLPYSEMIGFFPNETLVAACSFFAFLLGVSVLVVFATFYRNWRKDRLLNSAARRRRLATSALYIAVLLLVTSMPAGYFVGTWMDRQGDRAEILSFSKEGPFRALGLAQGGEKGQDLIPIADVVVPTVRRYDLEVSLEPERHWLDAKAGMTMDLDLSDDVLAPDDTSGPPEVWLAFTLRFGLEVTSVTSQKDGGSPLFFRRKGDWLLIDAEPALGGPSPRELQIVVAYSGHVWDWSPQPFNRMTTLSPSNFVATESTVLRPRSAWYPVAGLHNTGEHWNWRAMHSDERLSASHVPADFSIVVETPEGHEIVTGLPLANKQTSSASGDSLPPRPARFVFAGAGIQDVFLFAFPWERRESDGIITCFRKGRPSYLSGAARYVSERVSFYREILGEGGYATHRVHVIEVPARLFDIYLVSAPNTVTITEQFLDTLDHGSFSPGSWGALALNQQILRLWWVGADYSPGGLLDRFGLSHPVFWYVLSLGAEKFLGEGAYIKALDYWTGKSGEPRASGPDDLRPPLDIWVNGGINETTAAVFSTFHRIREEFGYDKMAAALRNFYQRYRRDSENELGARAIASTQPQKPPALVGLHGSSPSSDNGTGVGPSTNVGAAPPTITQMQAAILDRLGVMASLERDLGNLRQAMLEELGDSADVDGLVNHIRQAAMKHTPGYVTVKEERQQ
ncbi:MAG: hypothetical protein AB1700_07020 [Bacillota bacterium]